MSESFKFGDPVTNVFDTHDSITVLEAAIHMKITKLPTRIGEMERHGWVFPQHWEGEGNSRYKRYYKPKKAA